MEKKGVVIGRVERVPLIRCGEMCCWDWGRMVLPESRSDRSGEHDCVRVNQVIGNAAVGIFYGEVKVVVDGLFQKGFNSPIRRVNECGFLEQWVGFLDCF